MLTACGGTASDTDTTTSETSTTTEAPVTSEGPATHTETTVIETPVSPGPGSPPAEMPGPTEGDGDVTVQIPSPGIPSPPPVPAPPAIPAPPAVPMP
ncbi:hypothetical protein BA059_25270 [Mycolicibacterium sp. (ex Dasyatis americana)]|uniref:Uncharacterized protein n=2 Tax=Mycobacteriaceae TaxID=1762 RepID=A0A1Q9WC23_9MYCO|nr:hypothetical protein BA059_25270 [Mycolicibacterium sp. (ex Dasyatis americana)]OHT98978.1 hypothetical protein BKG61_14340 [Mycobacterium syngnathidarum]OLT96320.1 hypothetical protein BKG60_11805 [Mycobacterium syngnathidarum]